MRILARLFRVLLKTLRGLAEFLQKVVGWALLSISYFAGIGITAIVARMCGKNFLGQKSAKNIKPIGKIYPRRNCLRRNIIDNFDMNNVVQRFYNASPFPDYELDRFETTEDLELAAKTFSKILDRSIPQEASIIDVGTGTGQLSAFLSLRRENVLGVDFSDSSLNKARSLKEKLALKSLTLKKVDVLNEEQVENIGEKFDCLLCLGVLHHTDDPYEGFRNVTKLVKPGGYVAIGLYNKCGRTLLKIRRLLAKTIFRNNERAKEYFIRLQLGDEQDAETIRGWWNDQYEHPQETAHTVGEVLDWFEKNDIEYWGANPSLLFFDKSDPTISGAWNSADKRYPGPLARFCKQLKWMWTTHRDGGYWVMFGKKRNE